MTTVSPMTMMRERAELDVSVRDAERLDAGRSFQSMLARPENAPKATEETAREAAQQLVSVALVQPIFERLRSSSQASAPFGPGQAEKSFGPLLDAELSRRLTTRSNWPLVNEITKRLVAKLNQGEEVTA